MEWPRISQSGKGLCLLPISLVGVALGKRINEQEVSRELFCDDRGLRRTVTHWCHRLVLPRQRTGGGVLLALPFRGKAEVDYEGNLRRALARGPLRIVFLDVDGVLNTAATVSKSGSAPLETACVRQFVKVTDLSATAQTCC